MAEDVRSMSISLSMEDTNIDRTLSQVRRSFRSLSSDVKLINKDFQYGEKGLSDYKNRMTELDSAVKIAERNVGDLEKQYHAAGEAQGYNSKEALKLRQEWSKQKNELNFLQRDLKNATAGLKEFQRQQAIANSRWTKSSNMFSSMSKGLESMSGKLTSTGKSLTNSITKPALVAGAAVGGITAKLGFDRLIGLDSAKAKLEGLGYSTKEVGRISDQVTNAIKGGMTTMAEGTDVAAGALASGVKEGKELEHYIKLVGDAAVGANRPVSDMAMIFNRVQGQGKLMTQELNMVEEGMPGFSKAMAKHLGVSYEAFREMVTEGKVTSKDFLTVMDDFAGGMAGAYSKSWKGMIQNSKAYIGILGESMLKGVFPKAKESLYEFTQLMQSKQAKKWAEDIGKSLSSAFSVISNAISGLVGWFNSLDKDTQKSIASVMKWSTLILIGLGPVLTIMGKLTGALAGTFGGLSKFTGFMGKLSGESKVAGSLLGGFTNMFPKLGAAVGLVANPIGLTVLAVGALAAGLVIAYKKSETFRNIVNGAFEAVKVGLQALWEGIKTFLKPVTDAIVKFGGELKKSIGDFWAENGAQFMEALSNIKNAFISLWEACKPAIEGIGTGFAETFSVIKSIISAVMPVIIGILKVGWLLIQSLIVSVWNNIKGVITGALDIIMGVIKVFSGIFTADFSLMWEGIKQIFVGAFTFLWNLVQLWFIGKIFGIFKFGFSLIKGVVVASLTAIVTSFTTVLTSIWNFVKFIFTNIWQFLTNVFNGILNTTREVWGFIKSSITNIAQGISNIVRTIFNALSGAIRSIFSGISTASSTIWNGLKNAVVYTANLLYSSVRNIFEMLRSSLSSITNALSSGIRYTWNFLKDTVVNTARNLYNLVQSIFSSMSNALRSITSYLSSAVRNTFTYLKDAVVSTIRFLYSTLVDIFNLIRNTLTSIARGLKDAVTGNFRGLKDNAINLITRTKDGIVNGFKAMYDAGTSWIGKLKNFLGDSVAGFKNVAKKVGNGVANGAIGGLNAMIDGINTLSDKIMSKKLISKKIPTLSTGTGIQTDRNGLLKRGTKAVVNDKGLGNGKGPNGHKELIYRRGGKIEQPIGRNKQVNLRRGDGVINGAQSQSLLPHLSTGTVMDRLFGEGSGAKGSNKKPKDKKSAWETAGDKIGDSWSAAKDFGKSAISTAGKGIEAVMDGIGDVWDYVSDPGKLINKVLGGLGINFDGIGGAMGGFIGWGAKKLKEGMVELVTSWFESEGGGGGDGSSFTKFGITTPYSPDKPVPGYPTAFNGGRHYGIDYATPSGTVITAPTAGTVKQQSNHGGGLVARLLSGKIAQYFLHLSDVLKTGSVKKGEKFAVTGNSGAWTQGPHLHYQVENPASAELTNRNTMDPEKFLAGSGSGAKGGKGEAYARRIIKQAQGILGGSYKGSYVLENMVKLVRRESNFDPTAVNNWDSNARAGTPSKGLFQMIEPTFRANAKKGYGDFSNPLHQAISAMRYIVRRYGFGGFTRAANYAYKTGGIINQSGMYNLAEDGHSEVVVPLDPARSSDAMKLIAYATNKIQGRAKGNKRPNQMRTPSTTPSNNNDEIVSMLAAQVQRQDKQIDLLTKLVMATQNIENQPKGFSERDVSRAQGKRASRMNYITGGAF